LKPGQLETVNVPLPTGIQAGKYTLRVLSTSGISMATYVVEISSVSQQPLRLPLFSIVSYNSTILGAPSSSKRLVVGIVNDGGASGVAVVRVLDSSGNVASSASVSLSPGERTDVSLSVVLPPASGNYQWRIIAINNATGNQDDEKTVQVSVVTYLPVFSIVSYNSSIAGPAGSSQRLVVAVQNTGNASGSAVVTVIDNNGNTVNSTTLSIPAGQTATTTLTVTLPSSRGTYTWKIQALNLNTTRVDDEKTFTVPVYGELIKNGDFSQGNAYWTLENPWSVDTSLQLARIYLANRKNIDASLSQTFTVSSTTTLTQLQLYYYMYAHPPGLVNSLQLVVSIESGSTTLWSDTISWKTSEKPTEGDYTAQLSLQLSPGTYTLRIKALLNAGGNLNQVDIRVDNVSLLYAP
jgi:hypothetical protein